MTLVEAVQAKGSDARDVRDAAHEACHALDWGVKKRWTRDNIHARKPRVRAEGVRAEVFARAVEQLVSARLGFDCGTVEHWAFVCCMEMIKNEHINLPSVGWLAAAVRATMKTDAAADMSDRICGLVVAS